MEYANLSKDALNTKNGVVIWSLFLTQDCSKMDAKTFTFERYHHHVSKEADVEGRPFMLINQMAGVSRLEPRQPQSSSCVLILPALSTWSKLQDHQVA